jgi:nucleoside-diphosphate-sugar epimerase
MNSLIIGNTSQLSHYFPIEFERISSRNIDLTLYENSFYDRVFITFAEQRLNQITKDELYIKVNTNMTLELVKFFKDRANVVIVYGSCELWNSYYGEIDLSYPFRYQPRTIYTNYCISKQKMVQEIYSMNVDNVFVIHPFNFNSPYRKSGFLFSKVFDSIINKNKIELGDTYFYRDIIHPKYVVERSMLATSDEIVGSGRLMFVNDFIRTIYNLNRMNYNEWVTENISENTSERKRILFLNSKEIKYNNLLEDTLNDLKKFINEKNN